MGDDTGSLTRYFVTQEWRLGLPHWYRAEHYVGKKYSHYSDRRVQEGIDSGEFNVATVGLVRDGAGQIVKHITGHPAGVIPQTLIQVNNNIVFENNLDDFFNMMVSERETVLFSDLAKEYAKVMRKLIHYRDLGDNLTDVLNSSLNTATEFDLTIDDFMESADSILKSPERNVTTLDRLANLIFIRVFSGYLKYRSKFNDDHNSRQMLAKLERQTRSVYQQLVISGSGTEMNLRDSLYAHLYLDKERDIKLIDRLVEHDGRCGSALDFFESYRDECIRKKPSYPNDDYITYLHAFNRASVDTRLEVALGLAGVLDKIANIKNIISELEVAGEISEADIDRESGTIESPFSIFRITQENSKPGA